MYVVNSNRNSAVSDGVSTNLWSTSGPTTASDLFLQADYKEHYVLEVPIPISYCWKWGRMFPPYPSPWPYLLKKSVMICGVAVSKPTTSIMPLSLGSAIVTLVETMPTTADFAAIPVF